MSIFQTMDWIILALYFVVLIGIGIAMRHEKNIFLMIREVKYFLEVKYIMRKKLALVITIMGVLVFNGIPLRSAQFDYYEWLIIRDHANTIIDEESWVVAIGSDREPRKPYFAFYGEKEDWWNYNLKLRTNPNAVYGLMNKTE